MKYGSVLIVVFGRTKVSFYITIFSTQSRRLKVDIRVYAGRFFRWVWIREIVMYVKHKKVSRKDKVQTRNKILFVSESTLYNIFVFL